MLSQKSRNDEMFAVWRGRGKQEGQVLLLLEGKDLRCLREKGIE